MNIYAYKNSCLVVNMGCLFSMGLQTSRCRLPRSNNKDGINFEYYLVTGFKPQIMYWTTLLVFVLTNGLSLLVNCI